MGGGRGDEERWFGLGVWGLFIRMEKGEEVDLKYAREWGSNGGG